jgi:RimJ/RimL family protein N-acetyltransferase
MQSIDFLHLQMKLEGIGLDQDYDLIPIHPNPDEFPLFLFARLNNGETVCYFAASLPRKSQSALEEYIPCLRFPNVQDVCALFEQYDIHGKISHFKTYRFPDHYRGTIENDAIPFSKNDPRIRALGFGELDDTVYAIERNNVIPSACVSSRQDDSSAEAWVMTLPEQRGKGFGRTVVSRWANEVFRAGLIPFYSHEIDNIPSARLANRLGLIPVFEEIVLE